LIKQEIEEDESSYSALPLPLSTYFAPLKVEYSKENRYIIVV